MAFNIIKKISRGKFLGMDQEICDMYFTERKSLREICNELGCDNKFIRTFFKNNKFSLRTISDGKIHKNIIGNEEDIKTLYVDGWAYKDIAEKYSVDLGTIANCLDRQGVEIRGYKEARTTSKVLEKDKLRRIIFSDEDTLTIIGYYDEGYGSKEIGELFMCDPAVIKRILLENNVIFRSTQDMHTERTKRKAKESFEKKYGSWKERNIYLNKKFQEKYGDGLSGAMQVEDIFYKNQESGFKLKSVVINGMSVKYRGYELKAIYKLLSEGYEITDIIIGKGVPTIRYDFEDRKNRVYYPDIFIPKDNRIIEVKSKWTYEKELNKNLAKQQSTINLGYKFDFYIMDDG